MDTLIAVLFLAWVGELRVSFPVELSYRDDGPVHFNRGKFMFDQEIASLLEDAGYRFVPENARYKVIEGAAADETDHSSEFVADELGIPVEDLQRWEDEQLTEAG